jgi:hypothetical protein
VVDVAVAPGWVVVVEPPGAVEVVVDPPGRVVVVVVGRVVVVVVVVVDPTGGAVVVVAGRVVVVVVDGTTMAGMNTPPLPAGVPFDVAELSGGNR